MTTTRFSFTSEIWEHLGTSSWFFLSLPEDEADEIDEMFGYKAVGFGSIRVQVTIGATTWATSIFPDTKRGTYVLPVKKAVRVKENLVHGSTTQVLLEVV